MRILRVEDQQRIIKFLKAGLDAEHFIVDVAEDGERDAYLGRRMTTTSSCWTLTYPRRRSLRSVGRYARRKNNAYHRGVGGIRDIHKGEGGGLLIRSNATVLNPHNKLRTAWPPEIGPDRVSLGPIMQRICNRKCCCVHVLRAAVK